MTDELRRYAPERALPPYAFVPGLSPHPTRDPAGHSFGEEASADPPWTPGAEWRALADYLYGVDLYNHGFLWEAHEAWEGIWQVCKTDERLANFLQGLIQCSAASLKIPMGQPRGLAKLAELGTGRLEAVARECGGHYFGLDLFEFVPAFRAFAGAPEPRLDDRPRIELEDE